MWSDRPWHLHHQLIAAVSVLVLLAIGVMGGYTAIQQGETVLRGAQTQATTLARNMAISAGNPVLTDSLDVLEELVRRSADFEDVMEIRVLTTKGKVLSHAWRDAKGTPRILFDDADLKVLPPPGAKGDGPVLIQDPDARQLIVWYPIQAGQLVGWVRLDYSTQSVERLRFQIWTTSILVALLSIGVCGMFLVRFLSRPLLALRKATEFAVGLNQVTGQQLEVDRGSVEIESLGGALNEASLRLHQQMLAMQQQNECLGAIFSLSPDGLLTFDRLGRVEFANEAFLTLTGLARSQVEGANMAQLDSLLCSVEMPDTLPFPGVAACFLPVGGPGLAPKLTLRVPDHEEARILTFMGQHSETAAVSGVLYVCDVTQQQRLDQMKSDFLSLAAHELRTPMTSIFGFTELLKTRQLTPDKQKDLIERVYVQTQLMMVILNELLDLARIESKGGADLNMQTVDLYEEVSHLIQGFGQPPDRSPPVLLTSGQPMPVNLDHAKLRQMLVNVLSNAYKYSPNGGDVSVYFRRESRDGVAYFGVAVEDRGVGLKPDQLARMGERFYRADKSGHIPGTGLGVSIVKELAELMGAQLTYSSEWQVGTTVTLWFEAVP